MPDGEGGEASATRTHRTDGGVRDYDRLQEGKIDEADWIRCRKCDRSYSIEEWQRDLAPLGPDTDFVCQECRVVDRRKENNEQLDAYHPDRVHEAEYL